MTLKVLLIFSCISLYVKASPWDNLTANIAVIEYQSIEDPALSKDQNIMRNALRYIGILKSVNSSNLDMIIFPEATLRNNPETAVEVAMDNPCASTTYPQFLKDLSCSARDSRTYMVINLVEKAKCEQDSQNRNCKQFGFYFYNTDIIFDRDGTIIQRYRKYHLYKEDELDRPRLPEKVIFGTDFGIRFGIFTCFDILFKSPAQDLLEGKPDGVIFPTMWFSELPFLTALQTQQMWSYAHDIRVFGAGANKPAVGTGGTGVFEGSEGTAVEGVVAHGGSESLIYRSLNGKVAPSPEQNIDSLGKEMDAFRLYTDSSLSEFSYKLVDTSAKDLHQRICHGEGHHQLCCNFTMRMSAEVANSSRVSYTYFLVAFSGIRSFGGVHNAGVELCGLIACLNASLSSCGHRFPNYEDIEWPLTFEEVKIEARFENNENKTQFPNSLLSSIRPINARDTVWTWKETREGGTQYMDRIFHSKKPQNRILTFAIYGRDFARDSPPNKGSVWSVGVTWFLGFCTICLSLFARSRQ